MTFAERVLSGSSPRFRNHPGISPNGASEWLASHLSKSEHLLFGETGAASVSKLLWDTEQLGIACGRIDHFGAREELDALGVLQAATEKAKELEIEHLSVRCDGDDSMLIEALRNSGFAEVDQIITLVADLDDYEPTALGDRTRLAVEDDAWQVGRISEQVFKLDRFHNDPFIPTEMADKLHGEWGRNSVRRIAADETIIGLDNEGKVSGFVTCKLNRGTYEGLGKFVGTIVLVGTAPEAQGQGLGKAMIAHAMNWFLQSGCDLVEVGTQRNNHAAAGLYQKLGFKQTDSSISFRKWLGTGTSVIEVAEESATISK